MVHRRNPSCKSTRGKHGQFIDGLIFLTVLGILIAGFGVLKLMESAGYNKEYSGFLEKAHFTGSAIVVVIFAYDMVMKVIAIVLRGEKNER